MVSVVLSPNSIPDFVHPPVPGEEHVFYGSAHLDSIRLPAVAAAAQQQLQRQQQQQQHGSHPLALTAGNNSHLQSGDPLSAILVAATPTMVESATSTTTATTPTASNDRPQLGTPEETSWSRLMDACTEGHAQDVQDCLEAFPTLKDSIDNISSATGMNPLHFAASRGHADTVRALVDMAGAGVDVQDREGETALLKASYAGHLSIVCFLLKRGANVHQKDKDGWTALHNASSKGFINIAQVLLEKGHANVNARSKKGHTPLINAASMGDTGIVLYLVNHAKANPLLKNTFSETAYDTVYENQRASSSFPLSLMAPKFSAQALTQQDVCGPWSLSNGRPSTKDDVHLPLVTESRSSRSNTQRGWFWLTEWAVDKTDPNVDSEGWQYNKNFSDPNPSWSAAAPTSGSSWVRRRRWVRVMKKRVDLVPGASSSQSTQQDEMEDPFDHHSTGDYMRRAGLALRREDGFASQEQELIRYRQAIQIMLRGIKEDKDAGSKLLATEQVREYLDHAETLAQAIEGTGYTSGNESQLESPRPSMAPKPSDGGARELNEIRRLTLQQSTPDDDDACDPINADLTNSGSSMQEEPEENGQSGGSEEDADRDSFRTAGGTPDTNTSASSSRSTSNAAHVDNENEADQEVRPDVQQEEQEQLESELAEISVQETEDAGATNSSIPDQPSVTASGPAVLSAEEVHTQSVSVDSPSSDMSPAARLNAAYTEAPSYRRRSSPPTIQDTSSSQQIRSDRHRSTPSPPSNLNMPSQTRASRSATTDTVSSYSSPLSTTPRGYNSLGFEPRWELDHTVHECRQCSRKFSLWVRRHHCRKCGRVVCDRCSSRRATLHPSTVLYDPTSSEAYLQHQHLNRRGTLQSYRVCDSCHSMLQQNPSAAHSSSSTHGSYYSSSSNNRSHYYQQQQSSSSSSNNHYSSYHQSRQQQQQQQHPVYGSSPYGESSFQNADDSNYHLSSSRSSSSSNFQPAPMVRNTSSSSLMSECPVCGVILISLEGGKAAQEQHVQDCLEGKTGSGSPITSVRYVVYKLPADSPLVDQECAICFEEFVAGRTVARLNCLCTYHRHCIHNWLQHGKSCPQPIPATASPVLMTDPAPPAVPVPPPPLSSESKGSSSRNALNPTNRTATNASTSGAAKTKLNPEAKDYVPGSLKAGDNIDAGNKGAEKQQRQPQEHRTRPRSERNNQRRGGNNANAVASNDTDATNPAPQNSRAPGANAKEKRGPSAQSSGRSRNRTRNNRGTGTSARIDDDVDGQDDVIINLDRPADEDIPSEPRRRDRRRKNEGSRASTSANTNANTNTDANVSANANANANANTNASGSRSAPNNRRSKHTAVGNQAEGSSPSTSSRASGSQRRQQQQPRLRQGAPSGRGFPSRHGSDVDNEGPGPVGKGKSSAAGSPSQQSRTRTKAPRIKRTVEEARDLLTKLTVGLTDSTYECMVCWDVIRPAHKIWNCQVCWAAFHLDCISTWAKKSLEDSSAVGNGWRCPGCQNTQVSIPRDYSCFCGKVHNPDYNRYFTPHSCGELCGRSRECPHPCNIRKARCGDGEEQVTNVDGETKVGYYNCHDICDRMLACGNHHCSNECHPLDSEPGVCPKMPDLVKTCPCGSKPVEVLLKGESRKSCLDPIPLCGGVCKKALPCGHRCMQKCHLGKCAPCKMVVHVDCRCGSTRVQKICSEMGMFGEDVPLCDRPCRGLRSCGKHQCTKKCCPGKGISKNSKMSAEAQEAHTCPLVCGKKLQCGVHSCQELCHRGHCQPCLNASFDELSCACGKTVLYPPIACGTPIPKCRYSCPRVRECGHASLSNHPCHPDSEPCPPCTLLVSKQCMCRKSRMPNVPCYQSNPSCGKICGKGLECHLHQCPKSCHLGECLVNGEKCTQPCTKLRKSCGHRCNAICHGDSACDESQPCPTSIPASCKCGNLTMEMPCNATVDSPWDGKLRVIKCNDYCLIAERNRRVALALEIDTEAEPTPRIPEYPHHVLQYALTNMEFTEKIEKQIAEFMADESKHILYFPPMKGHKRKFVHELVGLYDLQSESVDVEPYRSVTLRKKQTSFVPDLLVSKACRQKRSSTPPPGTASAGGVEQLRKVRDPVNAIYLHDLAFGLTRNELAAKLAPIFGSIKYGIRWVTDDDAVLVPHPGVSQMDQLEAILIGLRNDIKSLAVKSDLAERVELCWVNKDGEVTSNSVTGSQAKRFFAASQAQHLAYKPAPAKVQNAFSLLDDDARVAAAKKAEEERILKEKEAAGTLSQDAWDEEPTGGRKVVASVIPAVSPKMTPLRGETSADADAAASGEEEDLSKFIVVEAGEFTSEVVDDWQQLVDENEEEEKEKEEKGEEEEKEGSAESKGEEEMQKDYVAASQAMATTDAAESETATLVEPAPTQQVE
ncbi:FKBP12-associated protein [Actinomortierella ambigua]|nr:FKBP12-associated protein [Actinomortierella ambigua]